MPRFAERRGLRTKRDTEPRQDAETRSKRELPGAGSGTPRRGCLAHDAIMASDFQEARWGPGGETPPRACIWAPPRHGASVTRPASYASPVRSPLALAIDLGSTRLKGAALGADGRLRIVAEAPPPPLEGKGLIREMDAAALLSRTSRILREAAKGTRRGAPLGIASQRSTFLLWDRRTGRPATPAVSWQDRRAAAWCERRKRLGWEKRLWPRTGLPLSPHYAACKLAAMLERDRELRVGLKNGRLLFGTLETWLVWNWTEGERYVTDLTMAARTLLADPRTGDWSVERQRDFGIPRGALPEILRTSGISIPLPHGLRLSASIADQPAVLLAATGGAADAAMVNLGTGCFALAGTGAQFRHLPGYLSGPILRGRHALYALEGTVNGGGAVADRFGREPTPLPGRDPAPDAFCLPDAAGVGAPYWRPEVPFTLSDAAERLPQREKRRIVLEGIVFRIAGILDDLSKTSKPGTRSPKRILVSGGLAGDPFVPAALASCLGRPVEVMTEHEGTLLGAARLAAGLDPCARPRTWAVRPDPLGSHLKEKYRRWTDWTNGMLASP